MGEAVLIPDTPYRYHFDECVDASALGRVVGLWRQMWSRLPEDVKHDWNQYMNGREYDAEPVAAFIAKDNPLAKSYAWSRWAGYAFLFKPEVLTLFSDDSILAICSHEFAHLYLTIKRDEYHVLQPFTADEKIECERRVDNCARAWGFSIDESREEEQRLRCENPDAFT